MQNYSKRLPGIVLGVLTMLASQLTLADFGFANSHCNRWMEVENADEEPARRQWIFGYLTAAARFGDKDLSYLDPNDAVERLKNYCAEHPQESLEAAVLAEILSQK